MRLIIDDSNWEQHVTPSNEHGTGYEQRDRAAWPVASSGFSKAFDLQVIPRSEWDDRMQAMKDANLRKVLERENISPLNQGSSNFCWTNALVTGLEAQRAASGMPYVKLSPASVAAPIKGYRNLGGWAGEALEYIIANGIASASLWPPNAIDRSYDNEATRADRKRHTITEWYDIDCDRDDLFDVLFTCVLLNMPVAIGLDWWRHEVCALYPVKDGNRYGLGCRNSWGSDYGENGFFELYGNKALPSDACVPLVTSAIASHQG